VYGFGAQWMRFAYFGVYKSERFGEYVGALAWLLCAGLTIVAIVLTALGAFGFFEPGFLIAVFALVRGITLYEAAFEVARTLLSAARRRLQRPAAPPRVLDRKCQIAMPRAEPAFLLRLQKE
jgi:hypothetical protein